MGQWQLIQTPEGLALKQPETPEKPILIDFTAGKTAYRRLYGGGAGKLLATAVGVKRFNKPSIWDLTAGFGQDAFALATLGCEISLFERHHQIHALLADALDRGMASHDESLKVILSRITLFHADALNRDNHPSTKPDVVFLDPMFPEREKTAQVQKGMQALQQVTGNDPDSKQLLLMAKEVAKKRIVVKRPKHAKPLGEQEPSFIFYGKKIRYDGYLPLITEQ